MAVDSIALFLLTVFLHICLQLVVVEPLELVLLEQGPSRHD